MVGSLRSDYRELDNDIHNSTLGLVVGLQYSTLGLVVFRNIILKNSIIDGADKAKYL